MIEHSGRHMTLREIWQRHYRSKQDKPRTIEAFRNALMHWERLTSNPPLGEVTVEMLTEFREQFLDDKHSGTTFNKVRRHLQALLNRCGPRMKGNPEGRGFLRFDEIPWCPQAREDTRPPRVATDADLSAMYHACEIAVWPQCCVPASLWWQTLLVVLYNVGLRRNDFLRLRVDQISLDRREMVFKAEKTDKLQVKPLNATVCQHLQKMIEIEIDPTRELVFPHANGSRRQLYKQWYTIQGEAGIPKPYFWFHEIRKTCGTRLFEQSPGAAQEMLGHSSIETTRRSYAVMSHQLRELADSMEQPDAFRGGSGDGPPTLPFRVVG